MKNVYLNSYLFYQYGAKKTIRDVLSKHCALANGILLDIGCGVKPYKEVFIKKVKHHYGTEFPGTYGTNNQDRGIIDFYSDSLFLPVRDNCIDTVLCTQVLEHVKDPNQLFFEVFRVLKTGGILFLTAPQEWGLHKEPNDFYRFTSYGLAHLAEMSGFKEVVLEPLRGFWALIGQKISTHFWRKVPSRKPLFYLKLILSPIFAAIQLFFLILDKIDYDPSSTQGYLLVVRK
jgi:SAM-dependent methyltransferase